MASGQAGAGGERLSRENDQRPKQVPPPGDVLIKEFREEMERRISALEAQVEALKNRSSGKPGRILIFSKKREGGEGAK